MTRIALVSLLIFAACAASSSYRSEADRRAEQGDVFAGALVQWAMVRKSGEQIDRNSVRGIWKRAVERACAIVPEALRERCVSQSLPAAARQKLCEPHAEFTASPAFKARVDAIMNGRPLSEARGDEVERLTAAYRMVEEHEAVLILALGCAWQADWALTSELPALYNVSAFELQSAITTLID